MADNYLILYWVPAFEIVISICSIGVSSYQFQSTTDANFKDEVCSIYPFKYLRPFGVQYQGSGTIYYCGYSDMITGFRLTIACLTIIVFGLNIVFKTFTDAVKMWKYIKYVMLALWYAVLVADSVTLGNASLACDDIIQSGDECYMDIFGASIAVDIFCILPLLAMVYFSVQKREADDSSRLSTSRV
jgi:hypothetical protein